ncbi:FAD-dependent oxidoreductase [Simiduia curdlanivorans]|uniref:FAD-dependent oxidoreductase n=1 Tax=Simiduia curdlanivorans TaxID=1492769 RepID=A0ABV8V796_9GAMM|nr:FAD-dependent oxidoreductase [Simiduia curdlanivorans]MDN3639120.1 FAD-dependent oxidoreductase [Simiduia curdlanivorans]
MSAGIDGAPAASYWRATATEPDYRTPAPKAVYDAAIVGAGYTGLTAAIALAHKGLSVALIDAQQPGWGASGRNGGFCCLGGDHLGIGAIEKRFGTEQAQRYVQAQLAAIAQVKRNCEDFNISADICGIGETLLAHREKTQAQLHQTQAAFQQHYGLEAQLLSSVELKQRGQCASASFAGLHMPAGFGLHPLKYCYGLVRAAQNLGVDFYNNHTVAALKHTSGRRQLNTSRGQLNARKVLMATNGYTQDAMHPSLNGRVLPALSNILVTRPLTQQELDSQGWWSTNPSYDTRNLLYYFRLLPDQRFLFGGRGGIRQSEASFAARRKQHGVDFQRYFPAWAQVDVDYFWRGHVALARQQTPHIAALGDELYCALAYHGNGVAMASWSGHKAAALMLKDAAAIAEVPAFMQNKPKAFPLPQLRTGYLAAAYLAYNCVD